MFVLGGEGVSPHKPRCTVIVIQRRRLVQVLARFFEPLDDVVVAADSVPRRRVIRVAVNQFVRQPEKSYEISIHGRYSDDTPDVEDSRAILEGRRDILLDLLPFSRIEMQLLKTQNGDFEWILGGRSNWIVFGKILHYLQ